MFRSYDRAFNLSKGNDIKNGGSRVEVLLETIYYIVTKVFSFKKKREIGV